MSFVHGSKTYVSYSGADLSAYIDNVTYNRAGDSHDVTAMGATSHAFIGGLLGGQLQISGTYDDSTNGPRDKLQPHVGQSASTVYRAEGTGSGLPTDTFSGLLVAYDETSPVADRKQWAATITVNGDVTSTNQ